MEKKYLNVLQKNPAPAREIPKEIMENVDILTPNETEFEIITGQVYETDEEFEEAMIE